MKKPLEYIKSSINFYFKKENFFFFAKISGILVLFEVLIYYLSAYLYSTGNFDFLDFNNVYWTIIFVVFSLVTVVFSIYKNSVFLQSIITQDKSVHNSFLLGWKKMGKYLAVSLVLGAIFIGGMILLIIPAFIFSVWYSFSIFLVLEKNVPVFKSFKESKLLVKGRFWKIFGRLVVIELFVILTSLVLNIIPYLGTFAASFFSPLFILPLYYLYKDAAGSTSLGQV